MNDNSAISILVVDDEPFMLTINAQVLTALGYSKLTLCEGAARALEIIDQSVKPPDLILLDLNMPDMDGVELVRHLVKRSYLGSLILLSGEDERMLLAAEKLVEAHHIAMLGYLRKPIKRELLAELLAKWDPSKAKKEGLSGQLTKPTRTYSGEQVRAAIAINELLNYYQPMVSLTTGQVVGKETLVRWRHTIDGLVFPDQFIDVAEENGAARVRHAEGFVSMLCQYSTTIHFQPRAGFGTAHRAIAAQRSRYYRAVVIVIQHAEVVGKVGFAKGVFETAVEIPFQAGATFILAGGFAGCAAAQSKEVA